MMENIFSSNVHMHFQKQRVTCTILRLKFRLGRDFGIIKTQKRLLQLKKHRELEF